MPADHPAKPALPLLPVAALLPGVAQALVVPIPEKVLQARVREQFPLTRRMPLGIDVELANPVVSLAGQDGRVGLALDAAVGLPSQPVVSGRADVSGLVRFEPAQGRFVLDDPRLEALQLPGVPPAYAGAVRAAVNAAASSLLRSLPLYTLDTGSFAESYAKRHLKSVRVKEGRLLLEFE